MKKVLVLLTILLLITGCGSKEEKVEKEDYGEKAGEIISNSNKKVKVYLFAKENCGNCLAADEFFTSLTEDDDYKDMFEYIYIDLYDENWNPSDFGIEQLMLDLATYFQDEFTATPYIVVGEKGFDSYNEEWQTNYKKEIKRCYEADTCSDPVKEMYEGNL